MATERTPLRTGTSENVPPYVFLYTQNRSYKNKIRKFQCCMCAGLLAIFVTALVITVSYSVNHDTEDNNHTVPDNISLQTLLSLSWPLKDEPYPATVGPEPASEEIDAAVEVGKKGLLLKSSYEEVLPEMVLDTPSFRHQMSTKTSLVAHELAKNGYVIDLASRELSKKSKGKKRPSKGPEVTPSLLPDGVCKEEKTKQCPVSKYRTADGSCNNLQHPNSWGVGLRPFRRILPPDYSDGVSAPRKASDGSLLPSAREVSLTIHRPLYRDDPKFTVMLAVWGQFMDHDVTATALSQGKGGSAITCCFTYLQSGMKQHPECYTVNLGKQDPFYEEFNVTCMEFVRSAPSPVCTFGPREQMNQASSFLDGSSVYGTTDQVMNQLRLFQGGLLKMLMTSTGRELLPVSTDLNDGCNRVEEFKNGRYCFLSGDPRSNENIHLTSMHLLFARQHNFVARKLAVVNPQWDDERLFQESRRIISSQIQHITYNEFLPVVLGPVSTVVAQSPDYFEGYNDAVDPSIANSFASSAFRFGHSLLPGLMKLIANDTSSEEYVELHKMLFNPFNLYEDEYLERVIMGAASTKVERVDTYFNKEVTEHLFERKPSVGKPKGPCGLDLVSLNVQRGRDHGLPAYPKWRQHCGLTKPNTFDDLSGEVDPDALENMKQMYQSVDDIDMYTGALAELPIAGGIIGPTLTCLLTDQFLRLKIGDRYWYETSEQPQAFSQAQLQELRKTSLSRIICDTSGVVHSQPWVMKTVSDDNVRGSCDDIQDLDYSVWKENITPSVNINTLPAKVKTVRRKDELSPKVVKLGGVVTGGHATVGGVTVWDGTLPVVLPLDPFDSVVPSNDPVFDTTPSTYAHSVHWKGSLDAESGAGSLHGSFSLPQYIHSTNLSKFNILWYNGDMELNFKLRWNSTNLDHISIDSTFSSALYFNRDKNAANSSSAVKSQVSVAASDVALVSDPGKTTPLILYGSVSDGNFIWSGNFTLVLPQSTPPVLKMAYTPSWYIKRVKIGARVESGSIRVLGRSMWAGGVPVAIPVNPFDSVAEPDAEADAEPVVYAHGIVWKGFLSSDSSGSATLSGSFSLPRYIHSNGRSNFSIRWYNGDFSLGLQLLWNSTKEDQINMDGSFSSPVYFSHRQEYLSLRNETLSNSFSDLSIDYSATPSQLSPDEEEGLRAPIVLLGVYSLDHKSFLWSGDLTLSLPKMVNLLGSPLKEASISAVAKAKSRLSLRLVGGQVKVETGNLWDGILPVGISVNWFDSVFPSGETSSKMFGHGVLWNGTLEPVDTTMVRLYGTFAFPRVTSNISIAWVNGNFDLHFQSNDSISLNGSYSTSVILAERKAYENLRTSSGVDVLAETLQSKFKNYAPLPIILLGAYSLDRTQFLWSGNLVLGLPGLKAEAPLLLAADVAEKVRLRARVIEGSVSVQGTGVWNGLLPIAIPVYPFDAVTVASSNSDPLYSHGVLWSGRLLVDSTTTAILSGTFSLPIVQHGAKRSSSSIRWFNGDVAVSLSLVWSSRNVSDVSGHYSSPVYFQTRKLFKFLNLNNTVDLISSVASSDTPGESPDGAQSAPLILTGVYSSDGTRFLWSGDLTLVLPLVPSLTLEEPEATPQLRIDAYVAGGSVTCNDQTVWVGNRVPIALPYQHLDDIVNTGVVDTPIVTSHGVVWKGFLNTDAPGTLKLWGSFSLPRYQHDNVTKKVSVEWYNGDFAFQLRVENVTKNTTFEGQLVSPLYFEDATLYEKLKSPQPDTLSLLGATSSINATQVSVDPPVYAPLVLLGTFSTDKTLFIWSGNISLIIPISPS